MSNFKGVGIMFIKEQLKARGPEFEKEFLNRLSPGDQDMFVNCLAFTWIPIEKAAKFYELAAQVLYPGESRGLVKIGKELAKNNLGGVYKLLVMIATIPYVVKQAAQFWKAYHEAGLATVITEQKNQLYFIVEQYPDLPKQFHELVQGYIEAIVEFAGGKMVNVKKGEPIKDGCKWFVSWE